MVSKGSTKMTTKRKRPSVDSSKVLRFYVQRDSNLHSCFFGSVPCIEHRSTRPVLACSCVRYISPDRVFAAFGHEGREREGGERTKKRKRIEPRFRARALLYPLPPRRRVRFVLFSRVSRHEQGVCIPRHRFSPELVDPRYKIYVSFKYLAKIHRLCNSISRFTMHRILGTTR